MSFFEDLCRKMLPPEKAEAMIVEHRQRIQEMRLKMRNQGVNRNKHQQRVTGVIPRPAYKAARSWVKKQAASLLREDLERAKQGSFLSMIPSEYNGWGLEKWIDRNMIGQFLCDMARQGILEPHPMGGWMIARPRIKDAEGQIVEHLELESKEE